MLRGRMTDMKIEIIERQQSNHQTEWGISFSGSSPTWDKYVKCHDRLEAIRLKGLIEQFAITMLVSEIERYITINKGESHT